MKRLLTFTVAVLLCISGTFAQEKTSYRQKVEILMAQGGDVAEIESQIREVLQAQLPAEAMESDSLRPMIEYLQNGLLNDLLDGYEASARKYMSEEDLDQMIEWMQQPESKSIKAKEATLAARLQNEDPEAMIPMGALINGMVAVLQGQQPDKLPSSHQNKQYIAAFHEYYMASNASETLKQTFDGILTTFGQYMQSDPEGTQKVKVATDYMVNNLEQVMLLMYEDIYTEDDLRYYTSFCRTPAFQHNAQASSDFAANISQLILNIVSKITKKQF